MDNQPGSTGNIIAAICSFFVPGLGQLLQGRVLAAIGWFVAACVAFWANVHVPRRTRATDPGVTAEASAGLQPSPTIRVRGPVTPPSGVVGEKVSAETATGPPSTTSCSRCASNRRAVNVGVCTS